MANSNAAFAYPVASIARRGPRSSGRPMIVRFAPVVREELLVYRQAEKKYRGQREGKAKASNGYPGTKASSTEGERTKRITGYRLTARSLVGLVVCSFGSTFLVAFELHCRAKNAMRLSDSKRLQ